MFAKLADTFFIEGKLFAFKGPLRTEGRKKGKELMSQELVRLSYCTYCDLIMY